MFERIDWRSLSWIGVADCPAPPGAGAGTGTVGAAPELHQRYISTAADCILNFWQWGIFKARKLVVSTSILQFQHGLSHLNQLQQPWWVYQSINQTFTSSRHPTGCSKDKRLFAYLEQLLSLTKIEFFTCCIWAARPSRGGSLATCKISGYWYKVLQCTVQSSIPSCPAKDREASTQRKREGKGKNLFLSSCSVSACPCLNIETCNHKNKTQIILSLNRSTGIIWTSKRKV